MLWFVVVQCLMHVNCWLLCCCCRSLLFRSFVADVGDVLFLVWGCCCCLLSVVSCFCLLVVLAVCRAILVFSSV